MEFDLFRNFVVKIIKRLYPTTCEVVYSTQLGPDPGFFDFSEGERFNAGLN